jgi:hypothetical protein
MDKDKNKDVFGDMSKVVAEVDRMRFSLSELFEKQLR